MPLSIISRQDLQISIHAPRTGSDISYAVPIIPSDYFNPRSPHGERQKERLITAEAEHFNPRSPHGERPYVDAQDASLDDFNPRSPHGERRVSQATYSCYERDFNPRSPHGERRG